MMMEPIAEEDGGGMDPSERSNIDEDEADDGHDHGGADYHGGEGDGSPSSQLPDYDHEAHPDGVGDIRASMILQHNSNHRNHQQQHDHILQSPTTNSSNADGSQNNKLLYIDYNDSFSQQKCTLCLTIG